MQGTTHMVGGAVLVAAYTVGRQLGLAPAEELTMIGLGIVGGLIPDIDHPNSKISNKLKPVSAFVSLMFSHRGFFHSPIIYLILWLLWLLRCPFPAYTLWGNCLFLGIASHLILDSLNPAGIPTLFPFSTKKYHFTKIRTGGTIESFIQISLLIGLCIIIGLYLF